MWEPELLFFRGHPAKQKRTAAAGGSINATVSGLPESLYSTLATEKNTRKDAAPRQDCVAGSRVAAKADGHGVEREGAEQVAAHALLDLIERARSRVKPIDAKPLSQAGQLGCKVQIAN